MTERFINKSFFNVDNFLYKDFIFKLGEVNNYPVLWMGWNLGLLLIPFFLFKILEKLYQKQGFKNNLHRILGIILFFLWLIFIPNTAYIITEVRHLLNYCSPGASMNVCTRNAWMIMFFFIYSVLGWVSLVLLLNQMKNFIVKLKNKTWGAVFAVVLIPLISLGVLLGLINRFNSWEIFINPWKIVEISGVYMTDWYYFRNWLVFTLGFYFLYFVGNNLFKSKFKK